MGWLDNRVAGAHDRQKQSLIAEAQAAGARVVQVIEGGQTDLGGVVGSTLTSLFGGSSRTDGLQLFQLDSGGWSQLYAQPYSGMQPLPGEHHALLAGALAAPIVLRPPSFAGAPRWECPQLPELAHWLSSVPAVTAACKAIEWSWKAGFTEISLPWTVQLRSVGDGSSHLVMQAARYGGIITYEVGFSAWRTIATALAGCLGAVPQPAQAFVQPTAFASVFGLLLAQGWQLPRAGRFGATPQPASAADSGVVIDHDYRAVIDEALRPFVGKRVYLLTIPPKSEATLRSKVLPPEHSQAPIVAAFDTTTFGSASDAVVLTPTHLFAKDMDERVSFELAQLESAKIGGVLGGRIDVELRGLGHLAVPLGAADAKPLAVVLTAIAERNRSGRPVQASAFVSEPGDGGGGATLQEAAALQAELQAVLHSDEVGAKINAAARLMTARQFAECIQAYAWIGQQHPAHAATCHAQIGAAHYFLGNFAVAISHYQYARSIGADPGMMDDNIREAEHALART